MLGSRLAGRTPRRHLLAVAVAAAATIAGTLTAAVATTEPAVSAATGTPPCQTPAKLTKAEARQTTGVTRTSVTVGNVSILTGPVPGLFEGAPTGVKAYFAYVNSKGGVNGRMLKVNSMDTGFKGETNTTETQSALDSDFAMVGNFSLFDSYGCKILAANPAFADVSVTLDPGTNALPNDYSVQPLAVGEALGPIAYIKKKYPKATRVGTVYATQASAIAQWDGEEAALVHVGYKVVYQQKISALTTTLTTEVIKMRAAHVQLVWLTALDWQSGAVIVKDMAAQGWHPTVILSGGPLYADQFIAAAGGASAADGVWIGQVQALYLGQDKATVPADSTFLHWVQQVNPGWQPDLFTLYGWTSAELFVDALKAAGKHPTRGGLLAQLQKITKFTATGLLAPTNPAMKLPSNCFLMAQIQHGAYARVVPKGSGFTCSTGAYFYAHGKP